MSEQNNSKQNYVELSIYAQRLSNEITSLAFIAQTIRSKINMDSAFPGTGNPPNFPQPPTMDNMSCFPSPGLIPNFILGGFNKQLDITTEQLDQVTKSVVDIQKQILDMIK